jgi:hypothetical protein
MTSSVILIALQNTTAVDTASSGVVVRAKNLIQNFYLRLLLLLSTTVTTEQ